MLIVVGIFAAIACIPLFVLLYSFVGLLMLTEMVAVVLEAIIDFVGYQLDSQINIVDEIFPRRD